VLLDAWKEERLMNLLLREDFKTLMDPRRADVRPPKSKAIEFTITNQSEATVEYRIGDRTFPLPPRLIRTHQRCRPSEVTFRWPDAEGEARIVQPSNGDRLVIRKVKGTFQVKKE